MSVTSSQSQVDGATPRGSIFAVKDISTEERKRQNAWWPVYHPENQLRQAWQASMAIPLIYTGTVMPYMICFVGFRVDPDNNQQKADSEVGWVVVNWMVDLMFIVDLLLQFTFSYYDVHGTLIVEPKRIAKAYFKGWFAADFIACLPPEAFEGVLGGAGNKMMRLPRLYRIARIVRLARLIRISKLIKVFEMMKHNAIIVSIKRFMAQNRLAKVLNFMMVLVGLAHLLGCVWFLIGAMSDDPQELSWLGRRELIGQSDFETWLNSIYFILTVFTTVGFGDIHPVTDSEVMFGAFLMMIGAIVNSVIVSEVIAVLLRADGMNVDIRQKRQAVTSYVAQIDLADDPFAGEMQGFAEFSTRRKYAQQEISSDSAFDWTLVWDVMQVMTPEMRQSLRKNVFHGALISNSFFDIRRGSGEALSLVASLFMKEKYMEAETMLFNYKDQPTSVFLIAKGVTAFVAVATERGGITDARLVNMDGPGVDQYPLSPYMLCSHSNYIGAWELMYPQARVASCRVETESVILELPKHAFIVLVSNFPQFFENCKLVGRRREARRKQFLTDHKREQTVESLAAQSVQRVLRGCLVRRRNRRCRTKIRTLIAFKEAPSSGKLRTEALFSIPEVGDKKKESNEAHVPLTVPVPTDLPGAVPADSQAAAPCEASTHSVESVIAEAENVLNPKSAQPVPAARPQALDAQAQITSLQTSKSKDKLDFHKAGVRQGDKKPALDMQKCAGSRSGGLDLQIDPAQLRPFELEMHQNMQNTVSRVNELSRGTEEMRSMLQQLYFLLFSSDRNMISVDLKS